MCGILGFYGTNTVQNQELIRRLMLQLSMRGTHATGFAWLHHTLGLRSSSLPESAEEYFRDFSPDFGPGDLRVIGHTRYSTSDLRWNQPMVRPGHALVMNGVISQDRPDEWPMAKFDQEGYKTGNDAEIALRFAAHSQRATMPGSWAICELLDNGKLFAYRNGHRPLWRASKPNCSVVCSTSDALLRCGLTPRRFPPGRILNMESGAWEYDFWPQQVQEECDHQPAVLSQYPDLQCHI